MEVKRLKSHMIQIPFSPTIIFQSVFFFSLLSSLIARPSITASVNNRTQVNEIHGSFFTHAIYNAESIISMIFFSFWFPLSQHPQKRASNNIRNVDISKKGCLSIASNVYKLFSPVSIKLPP